MEIHVEALEIYVEALEIFIDALEIHVEALEINVEALVIFIEALEIHVLDTVCAQIRRWLDAGFDVPRISVNLSAGRVSDSGLPARVQQCLDSHGVPSRYLMFEITETVAIQGMLQAVDTLKQFARMGVDVALDDFGEDLPDWIA